jgi:hypothetical protein
MVYERPFKTNPSCTMRGHQAKQVGKPEPDMRIPALVILLAAVAGCSALPDIDSAISPQAEAAPYPELVPLESITLTESAQEADPFAVQTILEGRVARLRARANALRGSVFDGGERQRLEAGLH